jgi:hypothetical protein
MVDIPLLIRDLVLFLLVALVVNLLTGKLRIPLLESTTRLCNL